jgi:hypothetical protein
MIRAVIAAFEFFVAQPRLAVSDLGKWLDAAWKDTKNNSQQWLCY